LVIISSETLCISSNSPTIKSKASATERLSRKAETEVRRIPALRVDILSLYRKNGRRVKGSFGRYTPGKRQTGPSSYWNYSESLCFNYT